MTVRQTFVKAPRKIPAFPAEISKYSEVGEAVNGMVTLACLF